LKYGLEYGKPFRRCVEEIALRKLKGEAFSDLLVRVLPSPPHLPSPRRVTIILHFREEKAEEFEHHSGRKCFRSLVSDCVDATHLPEGIQSYLLEAEIASEDAHAEFDKNQP